MALPPGVVHAITKLIDMGSTNFAFRMARFPAMFIYALTFSLMATLAIYLGKTFFAVIQPMTSFCLAHVIFFIAVFHYIMLVAFFVIISPTFVFVFDTLFSGNYHYWYDKDIVAKLERRAEKLGEDVDDGTFQSVRDTRVKVGAVLTSPIFVLFYHLHESEIVEYLSRKLISTGLISSGSITHSKGQNHGTFPNVVHHIDFWPNSFMRDMQTPILIMLFFCTFYFGAFVYQKIRNLINGRRG